MPHIAGALQPAKRSKDVIDSPQVLPGRWLWGWSDAVVRSIRFGIRIKRIADTHPELGLPSYSIEQRIPCGLC